MAKVNVIKSPTYHEHSKIRRPGVHSKNNTSRLKGSRNYVKAYRGQGRV